MMDRTRSAPSSLSPSTRQTPPQRPPPPLWTFPTPTRTAIQIFSFLSLLLLQVCISEGAPFVWIGGVTPTSFTIHADIPKDASQVLLSNVSDMSIVLDTRKPDDMSAVLGDVRIYRRLRRFVFTDLSPQTRYFVGYSTSRNNIVTDDNDADSNVDDDDERNKRTSLASVQTFPEEGEDTDLLLGFASCQMRASWDDAWSDIEKRVSLQLKETGKEKTPFLFMHMGDLAYSDIRQNDISRYEQAIRSVVTRADVQRVFNTTPVIYMYDDHDYGPNNSDGTSTSRNAAVTNYLTMVPHYSRKNTTATYHAFTIGRIRIIVTDLRSYSDRQSGLTTLGQEQLSWLLGEFSNSSKYSLVIWMSTKPWIGEDEPGDDSWSGFSVERAKIATMIKENRINNLIMIAGDAHMLGVDDGRNSPGNFPVLHAAPLGHFGTSKGGPYSHGCSAFRFFPNSQYGLLSISTIDQQTCIKFQGIRVRRSSPVMAFSKCGNFSWSASNNNDDTDPLNSKSCRLPWVPAWIWVVLTFAILWCTAFCVGLALFFRAVRLRARSTSAEAATK